MRLEGVTLFMAGVLGLVAGVVLMKTSPANCRMEFDEATQTRVFHCGHHTYYRFAPLQEEVQKLRHERDTPYDLRTQALEPLSKYSWYSFCPKPASVPLPKGLR